MDTWFNVRMSPHYKSDKLEDYASSLARVASLSNLFSESKTPFIHYRATEYLYARVLEAKNLARSDIAIDAKRGAFGVGLKTFVYTGRPKYEKIAEFNKEIASFDQLDPLPKIKAVAKLRNERIDFAGRLTGTNTFIYHCIARLPGKLFIFETLMPHIDIDHIVITDIKGKNISFTDRIDNYRFNSSKSTLFKEFYGKKGLFEKRVTMYEDPYKVLQTLDLEELPTVFHAQTTMPDQSESVFLPLYSLKDGQPFVYERSGLNQWNANGRDRDPNEVYIPVPVEVHRVAPDFFPPRDTPFKLQLPDGRTMSVKICQSGNKALMSQHNADLGEWLLRDVLNLQPNKLLTYEQLETIGVGAVEISKRGNTYSIDFKELGSYEAFLDNQPAATRS